ncbi:ABC transporter permease family protein [Olsenella urininfantis]|uniref:hypothetical protein n=1 Tax=Olsenella urininfantis TaxID=1871033 RepID=UPI0009879FBF|nr:hypothetical protein [Olsenella urininfantis]
MQDKTQVVAQLMAAQLAAATGQLGSQLTSAISAQVKGQMAGLSSALSSGFSFDSSAFACAPRLNVANIFNAETVIEGLTSGVFAVLAVYLISVPVNAVVYGWQGVPNIMSLPVPSALALVAMSALLTFVAGLVPAMGAARRDPVEALRSE